MDTEIEVLMIWNVESGPDWAAVETAVAASGGRLAAGYGPGAAVAVLSLGGRDALARALPDTATYIDTVDDSVVEAAGEPLRWALTAWNQRKRTEGAGARKGRGLPWDAPGFQPPDPPADVREMLRRREDKARGESSSDT